MSLYGWSNTYDSQAPSSAPQFPSHTPNNSSYPPYPMSAPASQPYSPQSAQYYNTPQAPPPYRTAQSTFYVDGPQVDNSNPYSAANPPRSPPPAYGEPFNNNYPQYQNNFSYNTTAYSPTPPPPPVGTSHPPQYPPISHHHHDKRNGNNSSSNSHKSTYAKSRTQSPENNNNNIARVYPQISSPPPSATSTDFRTYSQKSHHAKSETPLPPNAVLLWEGSRPIRLFFVQQEGHVVSTDKDLRFSAYKCPPMNDISSYPPGSLAGHARNASVLVKAENAWRLGLSRERSYIVRGIQGEFAFYDDSTTPARCVIIVFQRELKKEERQRLDVLLAGSSYISNEPSTAVDRFESGVGSVYGSFANSFDNMVKKQTPDLHKNTRWLRKTTGNVVRFGGNLVSKGVHLVSDNVMDKEKPKESTSNHQEIFAALWAYRTAVEKKKVSKVTSFQ